MNLNKWYNRLPPVTQKLVDTLVMYMWWILGGGAVGVILFNFGMMGLMATIITIAIVATGFLVLYAALRPLHKAISNWYEMTHRVDWRGDQQNTPWIRVKVLSVWSRVKSKFGSSRRVTEELEKRFDAVANNINTLIDTNKRLLEQVNVSCGHCKQCDSFLPTDTPGRGLCLNDNIIQMKMQFVPNEAFGCIFFIPEKEEGDQTNSRQAE